MKYTEIDLVVKGDTINLFRPSNFEKDSLLFILEDSTEILFHQRVDKKKYRSFFKEEILVSYYDDQPWLISLDSLFALPAMYKHAQVIARDKFSSFGILPYYLVQMKNKLTQAFLENDKRKIMRLSADFGHYIGDAHVPLHTTLNYNGELTDQVGIHAFWESRLPELFAEKEYDFYVGKAEYVDDVQSYFWDIILSSHQDVHIVLEKEKEIRARYPKDQQFCFDVRLDATQYLQCEEFAKAYHESLDGMVERRMKASIKAIGDLWYTCWVDAGQPKLI